MIKNQDKRLEDDKVRIKKQEEWMRKYSPKGLEDSSDVRRAEDDDRYINPNRINNSFDLINFDRIRSLERRLDEPNPKVNQTNQKVNEMEIKINKNTEDINRLTKMMETLAVSTQNHEEKMAKYDKMLEKLDQSLANNKIRIGNQKEITIAK